MTKTYYTNLPSPCWLLEEKLLQKNLEILKTVKEKKKNYFKKILRYLKLLKRKVVQKSFWPLKVMRYGKVLTLYDLTLTVVVLQVCMKRNWQMRCSKKKYILTHLHLKKTK